MRILVAGALFVALALGLFLMLPRPSGNDVSDLVSEFHGERTHLAEGLDPIDTKRISDNVDQYAFTTPVEEVKRSLRAKLASGGYNIADFGLSIDFRRGNGKEFGSLAYSRALFPKEPASTTCVLSLSKTSR